MPAHRPLPGKASQGTRTSSAIGPSFRHRYESPTILGVFPLEDCSRSLLSAFREHRCIGSMLHKDYIRKTGLHIFAPPECAGKKLQTLVIEHGRGKIGQFCRWLIYISVPSIDQTGGGGGGGGGGGRGELETWNTTSACRCSFEGWLGLNTWNTTAKGRICPQHEFRDPK